MQKAIILIDKYSDYLEASNLFVKNPLVEEATIIYVENDRNDFISMKTVFTSAIPSVHFHLKGFSRKEDLSPYFYQSIANLVAGDVVAAPFIRYSELWKQIGTLRKNRIETIHLSECFPDAFGLCGYRLAFRSGGGGMSKVKAFLSILYFVPFALKNKPDICYYPLYPKVRNPFVRNSRIAQMPALSNYKKEFFEKTCGNVKRKLLISGFGYDVQKMASFYNIDKYIATSKRKEIIIDGIQYDLQERICAEEVLASGKIDAICGYNSSVMAWSQTHFPEITVDCFEAKALNKKFGFLYGFLCKKIASKLGFSIQNECREMLQE